MTVSLGSWINFVRRQSCWDRAPVHSYYLIYLQTTRDEKCPAKRSKRRRPKKLSIDYRHLQIAVGSCVECQYRCRCLYVLEVLLVMLMSMLFRERRSVRPVQCLCVLVFPSTCTLELRVVAAFCSGWWRISCKKLQPAVQGKKRVTVKCRLSP